MKTIGVNPWGTWTEGFDWWTVNNWNSVSTQVSKSGGNFIGIHSYAEYLGNAEPTVWLGFEDDVVEGRVIKGYNSSYTTTLKGNGAYLPIPTSDYTGGAKYLFPSDCCCGVNGVSSDNDNDDDDDDDDDDDNDEGKKFGVPEGQCPVPKSTPHSTNFLNSVGSLLKSAFTYAHSISQLTTAIGSEVSLSDRAPPDFNFTKENAKEVYLGTFTRLKDLLGSHLSYYWFWTPESWAWEHYDYDFQDVADGLKDVVSGVGMYDETGGEEQWGFKLATCGWTLGALPPGCSDPWDEGDGQDSPDSDGQDSPDRYRCSTGKFFDDNVLSPSLAAMGSLTQSLGRNMTDDLGFGYVKSSGKGRDGWIMPWLESDDALGWNEIWVSRTVNTVRNASRLGADGVIGLHWRTKEVGPQYEAMLAAAWDPKMTPGKFWDEWGERNFGGRHGKEIARDVFRRVDGDKRLNSDGNPGVDGGEMPIFTNCCPGHVEIWEGQEIDCENLDREFRHLDLLEGFRNKVEKDSVEGDNLEYWINTFSYHKKGAESVCLLKSYRETQHTITSSPHLSNYSKAALQKEKLLPIRAQQVSKFDSLMADLLQTTRDIGGLGTVHNMQSATLRKILIEPDQELLSWNDYLPRGEKISPSDLPRPKAEYRGRRPIVFPLDPRNVFEITEGFSVTVGVLYGRGGGGDGDDDDDDDDDDDNDD